MNGKTLFDWADSITPLNPVPPDCPHKPQKPPSPVPRRPRPNTMRRRVQELLEAPCWWSLPELGEVLRESDGIQCMDTGIAATIRKLRRAGIFVRCRRRRGNLYEYTIGAPCDPEAPGKG
jgi:hypothetical protein